MYNSDDRPVGSLSETAYEILCETIESADGIRFDDAVAQVSAADLTTADAEYALERLINRGYLYEVDGRLFITERGDESEDSATES
jgi:hypothetical protein